MGGERLSLPPHPPDPIEASPLALTGLAADGCTEVGAVVR